MIESLEREGKWWLPEDQDTKLTGTLKFDPINGTRLELNGYFEKVGSLPSADSYMILGRLSDKDVTVFDCKQYEVHSSANGLTKSIFRADILFMGHHFDTVEDINFSNLTIEYKFLQEWIEKSGFDVNRKINSNNPCFIQYKFPERIILDLDNFKIEIYHGINISETGNFEMNLKQKAFIEIILNKPTPFFELRDDVCYHIQNFLSLGISEAISPLSITGDIEFKNEIYEDETYYKPVDIYYTVKNRILQEDNFYSGDMLFTLTDIADNFEESLKNWFNNREDLKSVYDLYFGTLNNSYMYPEHSFLSLIQALDSYHQRKYPGKYMSQNKYRKVRRLLIENIPDYLTESHRKSLEDRISTGYYFSLQARLEELFDDFESLFSLFIKDKDEFIEDVKVTRNYYTHYSKRLEKRAKKGEELLILTEKLKIIIEICFLKELNLPLSKIEELITRPLKYEHLLSE